MRLVCRHGWDAFAVALEAICQQGVKSYDVSPEAGEIWVRRARIVQELQKVKWGS